MIEYPKAASASGYAQLVEDYRSWLVTERGLAASTIGYYVPAARLLLSELGGRDLGELTLAEVTGFMVRHSRRLGVGTREEPGDRVAVVLGLSVLAGPDRSAAGSGCAGPAEAARGWPAPLVGLAGAGGAAGCQR